MEKKIKTKKVALTGGIGSGKSTVAKIFELIGTPVYYSDFEAKKIIHQDAEVKRQIVEVFGKKSYDANGNYNVPYVSSVVFQNEEKLKELNSIVHPKVWEDQNNWFQHQKSPYAIVENALLFETKSKGRYEKIIVVFSPDELRIRRISERDQISNEEVLERFRNQIPQEEKVKQADFVIKNNEQQSLIQQVLEIHKQLEF